MAQSITAAVCKFLHRIVVIVIYICGLLNKPELSQG
jgi:hypothetical protein